MSKNCSASSSSQASKSVRSPSNQPSTLLTARVGSNKLKSQLRQATRLLGKAGISEELRKATELKIEELKAALVHQPSKEQERSNAIRYHRIKFFDRKKILRRIKQVIRELDTLAAAPELTKNDARKKKRLDREAHTLRIDLHYVNAYPKHLKYVSLFPSGDYATPEALPSQLPSSVPSTKDANALRNYVRACMADAIEKGTLSLQPEVATQPELEEEIAEYGNEPSNPSQAEELAADDFFSTS